MVGDLVQVPEELMKLQRDIYFTADILFVHSIPFFIILIRNICFTAVNHLANRKVEIILKDFKDIYSYYTKRGFQKDNLTQCNLLSMRKYQEEPGSILKVQMKTSKKLNAKSE